jgi:putative hydrolase of the HAD superfamily
MIKAVFFDLYGTLIDIKTDEDEMWVYETLSRYLSYHSVFIKPYELKEAYFGAIQQHFNKSAEKYPEVDVYKIFSSIMRNYDGKKYSSTIIIDTCMLFRTLTMRHFSIFEGVYKALESIRAKYRTGIISDAQWVFAEPEIAMLGFERFFKNVILSSKFGFKKPDVRMFDLAMRNLGTIPDESVYIGDNPARDLIGAKNAGMKFILFRSECRSYNGFQPDRCFDNYSELEDILNDISYEQGA